MLDYYNRFLNYFHVNIWNYYFTLCSWIHLKRLDKTWHLCLALFFTTFKLRSDSITFQTFIEMLPQSQLDTVKVDSGETGHRGSYPTENLPDSNWTQLKTAPPQKCWKNTHTSKPPNHNHHISPPKSLRPQNLTPFEINFHNY